MGELTYPQLKKLHPDMPEACLRCKLFTYCQEKNQRVPMLMIADHGSKSALVIVEDAPAPIQTSRTKFYEHKYKWLLEGNIHDVFVAFAVKCVFPTSKLGKAGEIPKKYVMACSPLTHPEIEDLKKDYTTVVALLASETAGLTEFPLSSENRISVPYMTPIDDWQQERRDKAICRVENTLDRTLVKVPDSSFDKTLKHAWDIGRVGLDFEWSPTTGKLHTVGLSTDKFAWAGDVGHTGVWQEVKRLFADPRMTIIGHDLARAEVLKMVEAGVREINCKFSCGLIRSWELRKDETTKLKLKDIVWNDTDMEAYWGEEDVTDKEEYKNLMETPSQTVFDICRGDAFASFYYDQILTEDYAEAHERLVERGGFDMDMGMILPVANMMHRGIAVDMDRVRQKGIEIMNELPRIENHIKSQHGIDPNKVWQVQERLQKYGETVYNTTAEVMAELKQTTSNPAVEDLITNVLLFRKLQKVQSTFVEGIEDHVKNGKIHSYLKIATAVTGRGSASQPNIEQFPSHTRDMFCSSFGAANGELWTWDRSQSEYRCVAYMSQVKELIEAYMRGEDLHAFTAGHFDIKRKSAKNINFAGIFDATFEKLIYMLLKEGLSREIAEPKTRSFLEILEPVKRWQKKLINDAYTKGHIETPTGRRSYRLRKQQIVNTPVQGWSADLNKRTICEFFREMWSQKLESYIWLEFHDGTEMDVLKEEAPIIDEIAKDVFHILPDTEGRGVHLPFPLEKEVHGFRWLREEDS